jgi:hypothetical protein
MGGSMLLFCLLLWISMNWDALGWRPVVSVGGPPHLINWYFGWLLLWASTVAGSAYGLFGGDDSESASRRRGVWVALAATGAAGTLNLLYGLSGIPAAMSSAAAIASLCFLLTGLLLPAVCFLTLWRAWARFLVIVPIFTLSLGVFAAVRGEPEPPPGVGLFDQLSPDR